MARSGDPRIRRERILSGLPEHSVYVHIGNDPEAGPLGMFLHLEYDVNTNTPELGRE